MPIEDKNSNHFSSAVVSKREQRTDAVVLDNVMKIAAPNAHDKTSHVSSVDDALADKFNGVNSSMNQEKSERSNIFAKKIR